MFRKSWILTYWPHQHGLGVAAGKIFATILLQSWFSLNWYAKWPCSEKVEFWPTDPIPKIRGVVSWWLSGSSSRCHRVVCGLWLWYFLIILTIFVFRQNICYHVAAFWILFNFTCNMTIFWKILTPSPGSGVSAGKNIRYHVWKSWILTYWPHPQGRGGGGGLGGQNICYHVAALVILFNLICNMTLFWKSWILSYLPHPQGRGWSAGKIFVTMLLHAFVILFNLIYNMTVFWKSWMLTYWPHQHGLGVAAGKIFATILLQSWFSLIWYATWPCSETVAALVILLNLICNMTMFWKSEFWPTDPILWVGVGAGVCGQNICYNVAAFVILFKDV